MIVIYQLFLVYYWLIYTKNILINFWKVMLEPFWDKKINTINSYLKFEEVKEELEDRFGKINKEIEIYMYEEWLEKIAKKLNITSTYRIKKIRELLITQLEHILSKQ